MKDLHNVLILLKMNDLYLIEGMLYLEIIDFACFLRYLLFFASVHDNVIKSLNPNN
jgi:hypothetical protein